MKIEYINQSLVTLDNLSSNHNLGVVSDTVYNTFEDAFNNIHTSYTTSVYEGFMNNKRYLSLSLKKMIPLVGNRIAKFVKDKEIWYYYLIMDINGQLVNKKLLHKI